MRFEFTKGVWEVKQDFLSHNKVDDIEDVPVRSSRQTGRTFAPAFRGAPSAGRTRCTRLVLQSFKQISP